ncbi:MAG: hypothetical protein IT158_21285 [Bryobacterales bacterium]|nr:hypothetical protein [Bryobacterales bacterium]
MLVETGKSYRAKTAGGERISFRVIDQPDGEWPVVDLDSSDGAEPNVRLNLDVLLWISSEQRRDLALSRATEEVIEALERSGGTLTGLAGYR